MPAQDVAPAHPPSTSAPYAFGAAVTPSDAVALAFVTRALYVGVTGDVTAIMQNGTTILFKAMPIGLYPIRVSQVKATGTTASQIVALW